MYPGIRERRWGAEEVAGWAILALENDPFVVKNLAPNFTSSGSVHQLNYHLACIHQAFQRTVGFSKEIIGFIVVIPQVTLDLVKVL
ncbi:MAG: hypothetical protein ABI988_17755 [Nitrospirota bacterium]